MPNLGVGSGEHRVIPNKRTKVCSQEAQDLLATRNARRLLCDWPLEAQDKGANLPLSAGRDRLDGSSCDYAFASALYRQQLLGLLPKSGYKYILHSMDSTWLQSALSHTQYVYRNKQMS